MMKWTNEMLAEEALKYKSKIEFRIGSNSAYQTAQKRGILNIICKDLKQNHRWTDIELQEEALKYKNRSAFQKESNIAYQTAEYRSLLDQICSHMPIRANQSGENNPRFKWTLGKLMSEALRYNTRAKFQDHSADAYMAALRNGVLDQICSHMEKSRNISELEQNLLNIIKQIYPNARNMRDSKVKIINKTHIKRFDIDIYIPELNKGIEFDGKYYHSFEGLKRSRPNWPDEDIRNYHEIKDEYFLSKDIKVFHVKEEKWLEDKNVCISECFSFLGNE